MICKDCGLPLDPEWERPGTKIARSLDGRCAQCQLAYDERMQQ